MLRIYFQYYDVGAYLLKQRHKAEHALGMALLSRGLLELYHLDIPADIIESRLSYVDYQKPYLSDYPEIHFNISNCDGLVVCAFADSPVGVDIEPVEEFNEHVIRKLLTEKEKAFLESFKNDTEKYNEFFYRFWTLKESRIKQSGLGLAMPLTDFSFEFDLSGDIPAVCCSEKNLFFRQQILEKKNAGECPPTDEKITAARQPADAKTEAGQQPSTEKFMLSVCTDTPIDSLEIIGKEP